MAGFKLLAIVRKLILIGVLFVQLSRLLFSRLNYNILRYTDAFKREGATSTCKGKVCAFDVFLIPETLLKNRTVGVWIVRITVKSVRTLASPAPHWRDSTSLHEKLKEEEREIHLGTDLRNICFPCLVFGAVVSFFISWSF